MPFFTTPHGTATPNPALARARAVAEAQRVTLFMPNAGNDKFAQRRRASALADVSRVASQIWSWGTGATKSHSLASTINFYGNFRCTGIETVLAVHDFIAEFVPGGLEADLDEFTRDELRALMREARAAADAERKRILNKLNRLDLEG